MARSPDEPIPEDEPLYRSVAKEDIDPNLGVLAHSIEMAACSLNRSRYSAPDDVLSASRPKENGILEVTPGDLPPPIPRNDAVPYEFFAADDPIEGNDAHCEIRIRRSGSAYNAKHKPSADIKAKAREALARRMRVKRMPT